MASKKMTVGALIGGVIALVVLFVAAAELYPELSDAGSDLNQSGIPLGELFAGAILGLIVAAALIVTALKHFGIMH